MGEINEAERKIEKRTKRNEDNQKWKRHVYPNVHRSTVYNSQDMEAVKMSIDRWVDEKAVVHIYNGIFSAKTDAEAETPVFWSSDVNKWLIGKVPDAGKD